VRVQPSIMLLSPPGGFYAYVLAGFAQAFNACGYPCAWRNQRVDLEAMSGLLPGFDVAACVEINRTLPAGTPWPDGTAHLAWIRDHRFDGIDLTRDLGASHHHYFLANPSIYGIEPGAMRRWSILLPGARDDVRAAEGIEAHRDFCFAGFLPAPLDADSPVAFMPDGRPVTLQKVLEHLPSDTLRLSRFRLATIRSDLDAVCRRIGCSPITDQKVLNVFDNLLPRTIERKTMLESIITLGGTLDIYGQQNWLLWPQFAPYHRGFIQNTIELNAIFQSANINLHNSNHSMHSRVIDCLAAGGFLLINETLDDWGPAGIRKYLEPERHYGSYPIDNIAEVAKRYLSDQKTRALIAAEGRHEILRSHTWRHRAAQVLHDLNLPVKEAPSWSAHLVTSRTRERLQEALDQLPLAPIRTD
jgi:hypothetical protein